VVHGMARERSSVREKKKNERVGADGFYARAWEGWSRRENFFDRAMDGPDNAGVEQMRCFRKVGGRTETAVGVFYCAQRMGLNHRCGLGWRRFGAAGVTTKGAASLLIRLDVFGERCGTGAGATSAFCCEERLAGGSGE